MATFFAAHNRSKHHKLCALFHFQNLIYNLIDCLLFDFLSTLWTMWNSNPRIQKTKVIVNFSHSTDSRSWVPVCRLLVNRNSRWKTLNTLNGRFLHLSQKLSSIRRQRFHISSLSLGINCIKSERRFS